MQPFAFINHLQSESVFETKVKFFFKRKRFHLYIICKAKMFLILK